MKEPLHCLLPYKGTDLQLTPLYGANDSYQVHTNPIGNFNSRPPVRGRTPPGQRTPTLFNSRPVRGEPLGALLLKRHDVALIHAPPVRSEQPLPSFVVLATYFNSHPLMGANPC